MTEMTTELTEAPVQQDAPAPNKSDVDHLTGQLDDIMAMIESEFTNPVDKTRVEQVMFSLKTGKMAIEHLYEGKRQRDDLEDHWEREEAAGHMWYRQMGARPPARRK